MQEKYLKNIKYKIMNDKIKKLQEEIEREKRIISNCKHTFGKSYYNPTTKNEGYGYKMVAQGSDVWGEYQGYREVNVDRWSRKCTDCGFEEHTFEQKPIVTGYEPNFKK
jgi:hypothetical protein